MRFLFNEPATTEIYTFWHTLSRHDALPSSRRLALYRSRGLHREVWRRRILRPHRPVRPPGRPVRADRCAQPVGQERSEEHTSELQSLMRISYAVFCLQNKIITKHVVTQTLSRVRTQLAHQPHMTHKH